jgi:hypothetical protein
VVRCGAAACSACFYTSVCAHLMLLDRTLECSSLMKTISLLCYCCCCYTLAYDVNCAGSDFTEEGFECVVSFLYTGSVDGITTGVALDTAKQAVALQAADHFKLDALRHSAEQFALQHSNSSS